MLPSNPSGLAGRLQMGVVGGALVGLALVLHGWLSISGASPLSVAGAAIVLVAYGLIAVLIFPVVNHIHPQILRLACATGLLGGMIFAGEMLLEYILLPENNSIFGSVEYGSVFTLYFLTGIVAAVRSHQMRQGVLAAVVSAMISLLIWAIALLGIFYVFRGTSQQAQVFLSEGDYADFARSGMLSFDVWIVEDLMGATFFHLILGPLAAALTGGLGGLLGKGVGIVLRNKTRPVR